MFVRADYVCGCSDAIIPTDRLDQIRLDVPDRLDKIDRLSIIIVYCDRSDQIITFVYYIDIYLYLVTITQWIHSPLYLSRLSLPAQLTRCDTGSGEVYGDMMERLPT